MDHRRGTHKLILLLSMLALTSATGRAKGRRLRIDRIDTSRCPEHQTVEIHGVDLTREGEPDTRPVAQYRLRIADKTLKPTRSQPALSRADALSIALVLQSSEAYRTALPELRAGASSLLSRAPRASQVTVIGYGSTVQVLLERGSPGQAAAALDSVLVDTGVELELVSAIESALKHVRVTRRAMRSAIVVVSDGIDRDPEWDRFRALARRARRAGVPIHPIAYTPIDERGPLLNLGELAKRTRGTLRWARNATDLATHFRNLAAELSGQLRLRFRLPTRCTRPLTVQLSDGTNTSAPERVASVSAGPEDATRGCAGAGLALAAVVLLLLVATLLLLRGRRRRR